MALRQAHKRDDSGTQLPASAVMLDGWRRLAAAVLIQALRDFASDDPAAHWDAAIWLAAGQSTKYFADCVGLHDPLDYMRRPGFYRKLHQKKVERMIGL